MIGEDPLIYSIFTTVIVAVKVVSLVLVSFGALLVELLRRTGLKVRWCLMFGKIRCGAWMGQNCLIKIV